MTVDDSASLRIAHYTRRWLPQTQTWLYNQVRYLPDDIEPHVICERTENLEQFDVPNIHCLAEHSVVRYYREVGLRLLGVRPYYPFTIDRARALEADLLHSHFGHTGWRNIRVAEQLDIPHVVTFYGNDISGYPQKDKRWIDRYRELFCTVAAVLCEGPHMARSAVELGCPEEKVHVHHLGVGVENIVFEPRRYRPGEPLRVLIAASFREKKGIPYAIEALGRLHREVPVEVTIIGGVARVPILGFWNKPVSGSQEEKERIVEAVDRWNLTDNVRMLGYQPYDALLEEAYRHHVFLSPSVTASSGDTEGGAPVTLIEMSASGMPIVSTTHCDIPSVVKHGETGLLAPERDVEALVDHLNHLINHPEIWPEMAQAARRHVEEEYNAPIQGQRLGALYRKIAADV